MKACVSILAGVTILNAFQAHAGGVCRAESGATTAALVELYTSEGCSSCPPADAALRQLRRSAGPQAGVIPLALHVGYWDQIGWKDMFAQKAFDARQAELVARGKGAAVYTPQVFVNGHALHTWRGALPGAIGQVNAQPAQARIRLASTPVSASGLRLEAVADARTATGHRALYVALSESALVSHVTRGENSGATLHHDDTARTWIGPIALSNGHARFRQEIRLAPEWNAHQLNLVAFVQDQDDGSVIQAVSTADCAPGGDP